MSQYSSSMVTSKDISDHKVKMTSNSKIDLLISLFSGWFLAGLYWDGWSHIHELPETFFTPSHILLYTGFAVTGLSVFILVFYNLYLRYGIREAIPAGYEWSFVGAIIFGTAGFMDMIWHEIFGIEADIEALLSPPHLILFLGATLLILGPFRSSISKLKNENGDIYCTFAFFISSTVFLSWITFFTMYANPFTFGMQFNSEYLPGSPEFELSQALGITSILLFSCILVGYLLFLIKNLKLPMGFITGIIAINILLMSYLTESYLFIVLGFIIGVSLDFILIVYQKYIETPFRYKMIGFTTPLLFFLLYFAGLNLVVTLTWSFNLILGSIILASFLGLAMSILFFS